MDTEATKDLEASNLFTELHNYTKLVNGNNLKGFRLVNEKVGNGPHNITYLLFGWSSRPASQVEKHFPKCA